MQYRYKWTAIIIGLLLFSLKGLSQEERSTSSEAFQTIKNGSLIVRLSVNENKKKYLEQAISEAVDFSIKEEFQNKLNQYQADRTRYVSEAMYVFQESFNLCQVLFYFDTDHEKFIKREKGIFLNKDGIIDASISYPEGNFLLMVKKESDFTLGSASGMKVLDEYGNTIPPPFPQPKRPSFFQSLFFKSGDKKLNPRYNEELDLMVSKWEQSIRKKW